MKSTVAFAKSLRDAIDAYAKAQGWSLQRFIREAVVDYLKRHHAIPEKKDED